jgi:hypothetical protein
MDVAMVIEYEGIEVHTEMQMADGYPRMRIVEVVAPAE